jgi:excinuclease ABC subunit A
LHFEDINVLLKVLNKLVDKGNTVIVIEHNMDVIKMADYIIDLGLEGGDRGGQIICEGSPESIINCSQSYTAQFLKPIIEK